jgi:hypothetical protein
MKVWKISNFSSIGVVIFINQGEKVFLPLAGGVYPCRRRRETVAKMAV